jgi:hypothetical protein
VVWGGGGGGAVVVGVRVVVRTRWARTIVAIITSNANWPVGPVATDLFEASR